MRAILGLALTTLLSAPALAGTDYADTVFWSDVGGGGGDFPAAMADATVLGIYAQTWHPSPWTGFGGAQSTAWLIGWDCGGGDPFAFPLSLPAPYIGQAAFAPENDEFYLEIAASDLTLPVPSGLLCLEVAAWNEAEPPGDSGTAQWGFYVDDPIVLSVECTDANGDDICDAAVPPGCLSDEACDDGLFCNGTETCDLGTGACEPGAPPWTMACRAPSTCATRRWTRCGMPRMMAPVTTASAAPPTCAIRFLAASTRWMTAHARPIPARSPSATPTWTA